MLDFIIFFCYKILNTKQGKRQWIYIFSPVCKNKSCLFLYNTQTYRVVFQKGGFFQRYTPSNGIKIWIVNNIDIKSFLMKK